MIGIVDWAINRARLTISLLIAVIVVGIYSYMSIPKEADPDIPVPYFQIFVSLQGISPSASTMRGKFHTRSRSDGKVMKTAFSFCWPEPKPKST